MERSSQTETTSEQRKARRRLIWARAVIVVGALSAVAGVIALTIGLGGLFGGYDQDAPAESAVPGGLDLNQGTSDGSLGVADAIIYNNQPPIYMMTIDSIGVDAPVMKLWADSDGVPLTPNSPDNVAWYNFSAKPGSGGNAVLAGHFTWNRAPAVFADLDDIDDGDIIRLESEDGKHLVYEVFTSFSIDPSSPDSLQVMAPTATDTITLITCGGTWIADGTGLFGGDFTERIVVQGRLVSPTAERSITSYLSDG